MDFNPDDPQVIGPEFAALWARTRQPATSDHVAQAFHSTATETINNLRLHGLSTATGRPFIAEVYEAANLVPPSPPQITQSLYVPNASMNVLGGLPGQGDPVTDQDLNPNAAFWDLINDGLTPNAANYLRIQPTASVDLELSTSTYAASGRIVNVSVLLTLHTTLNVAFWAEVSIVAGGTAYGLLRLLIPRPSETPGAPGKRWFSWGEINPVTNLPWTVDDIRAFDLGTYRLRLGRPDWDQWAVLMVDNLNFMVTAESTERRLAVATHIPTTITPAPAAPGAPFSLTSSVPGAAWTSNIAMHRVDGSLGWPKIATLDYYLAVREAFLGDRAPNGGTTSLYLTTLEAIAGSTVPADYSGDDLVTSTVSNQAPASIPQVPPLMVSMPSASSVLNTTTGGELLAFALMTDASAVSVDSQPYTAVQYVRVSAASGSTEGEVRSSTTDTFGFVRVGVGNIPGNAPTEALTIEVRRRSDDFLMGTCTLPHTVTIPAAGAVFDAQSSTPINLVAGVQYYLTFSSLTPPNRPWVITAMLTEAAYESASYGGATDVGTPLDGTAAHGDISALVTLDIDKPANFTVTSTLSPLPDPAMGTGCDDPPCSMDGIPCAQITWASTNLGIDFDHYEIDRLAPDGVTWQVIASITDEDVNSFYDFEARLGVQETYRMRVVTYGGASSFFTTDTPVTVSTAGCGYTFTSNEATDLSVAYPDVYSGDAVRDYEFPEADEVVYKKMYGRDLQVAFKPLSRRGVMFERTLFIADLASVAGIGPPAADLIRDLAWASLSYVCVRDNNGNRWFMSITVPDLAVRGAASGLRMMHTVTITAVEVTTTPSQPDANTLGGGEAGVAAAGSAIAVAVAYNAQVSGGEVSVSAGVATATGVANSATATAGTTNINAGTGAGSGTANDALISASGQISVPAGVAAGSSAAYDASIPPPGGEPAWPDNYYDFPGVTFTEITWVLAPWLPNQTITAYSINEQSGDPSINNAGNGWTGYHLVDCRIRSREGPRANGAFMSLDHCYIETVAQAGDHSDCVQHWEGVGFTITDSKLLAGGNGATCIFAADHSSGTITLDGVYFGAVPGTNAPNYLLVVNAISGDYGCDELIVRNCVFEKGVTVYDEIAIMPLVNVTEWSNNYWDDGTPIAAP